MSEWQIWAVVGNQMLSCNTEVFIGRWCCNESAYYMYVLYTCRETGSAKRGFGSVLPHHAEDYNKFHFETTNKTDFKPPFPYTPAEVRVLLFVFLDQIILFLNSGHNYHPTVLLFHMMFWLISCMVLYSCVFLKISLTVVILDSGYGLLPIRHQAITWTNDKILWHHGPVSLRLKIS